MQFNKKTKIFMENTIINFSRAIKDNNPELTWAILMNLDSVLGSYVEQARKEMLNEIKRVRPEIRTNRKKAL